MREPWLFVFGAAFGIGAMTTLLLLRTFDRRANRLGWREEDEDFAKRRRLQFAACIAAAIGIFMTVAYGLGMPSGAGRASEFGLALFRKDIARYQYRTVMTMFGRSRPEHEQEQHQVRAMESLGIAFSVLLFITGTVLLTLNLAFSS